MNKEEIIKLFFENCSIEQDTTGLPKFEINEEQLQAFADALVKVDGECNVSETQKNVPVTLYFEVNEQDSDQCETICGSKYAPKDTATIGSNICQDCTHCMIYGGDFNIVVCSAPDKVAAAKK